MMKMHVCGASKACSCQEQ